MIGPWLTAIFIYVACFCMTAKGMRLYDAKRYPYEQFSDAEVGFFATIWPVCWVIWALYLLISYAICVPFEFLFAKLGRLIK